MPKCLDLFRSNISLCENMRHENYERIIRAWSGRRLLLLLYIVLKLLYFFIFRKIVRNFIFPKNINVWNTDLQRYVHVRLFFLFSFCDQWTFYFGFFLFCLHYILSSLELRFKWDFLIEKYSLPSVVVGVVNVVVNVSHLCLFSRTSGPILS